MPTDFLSLVVFLLKLFATVGLVIGAMLAIITPEFKDQETQFARRIMAFLVLLIALKLLTVW